MWTRFIASLPTPLDIEQIFQYTYLRTILWGELLALDIEKELQSLLPRTEKLAEAEPAARVVAARVRAFMAGLKQVIVHSREDFARALRNVRMQHWLPAENLFLEEATVGSSTLHAVRKAYEVLGPERIRFSVPGVERDRQVSAYQKGLRPSAGAHARPRPRPERPWPARVRRAQAPSRRGSRSHRDGGRGAARSRAPLPSAATPRTTRPRRAPRRRSRPCAGGSHTHPGRRRERTHADDVRQRGT